MKKPFMIMILDGFGLAPAGSGNAISQADTPNLDKIFDTYPWTKLEASGLSVGLPDGQMGNSEVGHLNIGAGRIVYQELTRITKSIDEGIFAGNAALLKSIDHAKESGGVLHIMGLLSDGGVHSHIDHIKATISLAASHGLSKIFVHCFMDGRDVSPTSGIEYMELLENFVKDLPGVSVGAVSGRYYAMDRDKRWERVQLAYGAIALAQGLHAESGVEAVKAAYADGKTDEFIVPTVCGDFSGVNSGDSIIFCNFRPDRAREITRCFVDPDFSFGGSGAKGGGAGGGVANSGVPANGGAADKSTADGVPAGANAGGDPAVEICRIANLQYTCMTQYDATMPNVDIAFPPSSIKNTLGEYLASLGLNQLRIAETEKYAHVTFFFNGGVEKPNNLEDRLLIPSPKVATYDLKPEMSAFEVTDKVIEEIKSDKYDCIILNFANADMVGHTGVFDAAVKAIEAVDKCVGRVAEAMIEAGGEILLTADHGNADNMLDEAGSPVTAHSTNPVPLVHIAQNPVSAFADGGKLCDIAPTLLQLMNLSIPAEMTGKPLV